MRRGPVGPVTVVLALTVPGCVYFRPVSTPPSGPASGAAHAPAISADGRYVAFASDDPTLTSGDTNGVRDVFVRDLRTGTLRRVSVATGGTQADGPSDTPAISADGRFVAFTSAAANLTGDDTNGVRDVFVHDTAAGTTTRVSTPPPGLWTWDATGTATGGVVASRTSRAPRAAVRVARPGSHRRAAGGSAVGADGRVRVLVRLRVPFRPEGLLDPAARSRQHARIADAAARVERRLVRTGDRVVRRFATVPFVAAELSPAGLAAVAGDPAVAAVVPDRAEPPALPASRVLVGAAAAERAGWDGSGGTVAVLDTGADPTHPALAGRVVSEACYSRHRSCPNGRRSQTSAGAGAPCTFAPADCAHGTHAASIAMGGTPPARGVAPGATLVSIQVFSEFSGAACAGAGSDPCALSYVSDQIAGLERVHALRSAWPVRAVNLSIAGDPTPTPCDDDPRAPIIATLRSVGIPTVVASGNHGDPTRLSRPACVGAAVSVGATTLGDEVAAFSNGAPGHLTLLAPGVDITAAVPGGSAALSGTSMAAPHVAGAITVLRQASPTVPLDALLAWVRATGQPVTDPRTGTVTPRLCLDAALGLGGCHRPANDAFADARPLTGAVGVIDGDTLGASREPGEPDHAGRPGGRSVWYRWRAPATGRLDLDLAGSGFDTLLAVYVGDTPASLWPVAADDDAVGGGRSALAGVPVVEGVTYRIAVDGAAGASGLVVLRHAFTSLARDRGPPSISGDGRVVAYVTDDPGLTTGDTNGVPDVFLVDRTAGTTTRVSVSSTGAQANGWSGEPSLSGSGLRVAFTSAAGNLTPGDTNGVPDVFLVDRTAGTTTRVSVSSTGAQANGWSGEPSLSADGTTVAFTSAAGNLTPGDTNGVPDVFRRRPAAGSTDRMSVSSTGAQANGASRSPSVSGGGGAVAFVSAATNLDPGDTNGVSDAFVRVGDRTRRVSADGGGTAADGPTDAVVLSGDRRYAAFRATAGNLGGTPGAIPGIYVRYAVVPEIGTVAPASWPVGATGTVTVTGSGFLAGPPPTVELGEGIMVASVSVPSDDTLHVRITVESYATPGRRDVVVTNPGTGPGPDAAAPARCGGCLTVTG